MAYDSARRSVRALEAQLDALLASSSGSSASAASALEDGTSSSSSSSSLPELLTSLRRANDALAAALPADASQAQRAAVQRHADVLDDAERECARMNKRGRRDVLGDVRRDIDSYKTRHGAEEGSLLYERDRLGNSHSMIDGTLDQAYATRASLASQRSILQSTTARLRASAAQVPALNTLITRINRRRRRDSVIMGLVIGVCTLGLLWGIMR